MPGRTAEDLPEGVSDGGRAVAVTGGCSVAVFAQWSHLFSPGLCNTRGIKIKGVCTGGESKANPI